MRNTKGTVVYQIEKDGCLNGLYQNEEQPEKTYNEIARQTDCTDENDPLLGTYISSWIDIDNTVKVGNLIISKYTNIYLLSWSIDNKIVYTGEGTITNSGKLKASFCSI